MSFSIYAFADSGGGGGQEGNKGLKSVFVCDQDAQNCVQVSDSDLPELLGKIEAGAEGNHPEAGGGGGEGN